MDSEINPRLGAVAITGRILGTLFYHAPDSENARPLLALFANSNWLTEWPARSQELPALAQQMALGLSNPQALNAAWQRLFIGPWALPVAPWGSVWLDREKVLFGESTLALRQWMSERHITHLAQQNEPEDHIGLLLMLAAWLAESSDEAALDELLAWHLLPWARHYLSSFTRLADNPFYEALGKLSQLTLTRWQSEMVIPVADKALFI